MRRAFVIGLLVVAGALGVGAWAHSTAPAPDASQSTTVAAPAAAAAVDAGRDEQTDGAADARSDSTTDADTFHGYTCTVDCSGHEAGYQWADDNGITDPDDCPIDPHNSHSFTEGCWAFAGRDGP